MAIQPTACLANPQRHLPEGSLRPADDGCPLCGHAERRAVYRIQRDPPVELLRCLRCHGASASRLPTDEALHDYYAGYYDPGHSPTMAEESVTMVDPFRLSRHIFRRLDDPLPPGPARIIDYGGGDGTIALGVGRLMRRRGVPSVTVDVVDMHPRPGAAVEEGLILRQSGTLPDVAAGECAVVLASGILEHLPYPMDVLRGLLARLRRGGLFYARTPFELPLIRLAGRLGQRLEMGFPGHVHDMGQDFWESMLEIQGLSGEYALRESKPSIVATTLGSHFIRSVLAYTLKGPWYLLGRRYGLVGGWEVFIRRRS